MSLASRGLSRAANIPKMKRGNVTLIIPNEHEEEIGPGFLSRLLRQAGVSREEWLGEK